MENPWNFFRYKYVISLKHRSDRREHVKKELTRFGIYDNFKIFDAVYGKECLYMRNYLSTNKIIPAGSVLSDGELGCLFSHYLVWLECLLKVRNERDEFWILILEDDAKFHPKFTNSKFSEIISNIPKNALYLKFGFLVGSYEKATVDISNPYWKKLCNVTFSTIAYAVKSRYLLNLLNTVYFYPIDHQLHSVNAYALKDIYDDDNTDNEFFDRECINMEFNGSFSYFKEKYRGIIGARENGIDSDVNISHVLFAQKFRNGSIQIPSEKKHIFSKFIH